MKKPGEYADTKLDDYCLLDEVLSCIDLVEKRNQNTAFLSDHDQGWNEKYQRENNQTLVDQKKLDLFVDNMFFGVTACFLVIFLLCSSFANASLLCPVFVTQRIGLTCTSYSIAKEKSEYSVSFGS